MKPDLYTKTILTIIALALVSIAFQLGARPVPAAFAAETQHVRLDGPIEVRPIEVKVSWDFSAPGSSTSSPLYVKPIGP